MIKKQHIIILLFLYLIVQLIYVFFFHLPFYSDSLNYFNFAETAISNHSFYPDPPSLYSDWIQAPVYINYLILLLKIYNHQFIILFCNIGLNFLQLLLIFKITEKLFNEQTAFISIVLYIFYLNNIGAILNNLTELMFGVFILSGFYLVLFSEKKYIHLLAGFIIGLAIGVRPTGYALLLSFVLVLFFITQRKEWFTKIIFVILGLFIYIIPMGLLSKSNIGYFVFSSQHGSYNLMFSANDRATGIYDDYFLKHDSILKTKKTFVEKEDYFRKCSTTWIKKNPIKWLKLMPRKIYSMFISDDWCVSQLLHTNEWNFNLYIKSYKDAALRTEFQTHSLLFRIAFIFLNILHQIYYLILLSILIYLPFYYFRKKQFNYSKILILSFIFIVISMTVIASVGSIRYKYNIFIMAFILISDFINQKIQRYYRNSGF